MRFPRTRGRCLSPSSLDRYTGLWQSVSRCRRQKKTAGTISCTTCACNRNTWRKVFPCLVSSWCSEAWVCKNGYGKERPPPSWRFGCLQTYANRCQNSITLATYTEISSLGISYFFRYVSKKPTLLFSNLNITFLWILWSRKYFF